MIGMTPTVSQSTHDTQDNRVPHVAVIVDTHDIDIQYPHSFPLFNAEALERNGIGPRQQGGNTSRKGLSLINRRAWLEARRAECGKVDVWNYH